MKDSILYKNGTTSEILSDTYTLVSAMDRIEKPVTRVQAVCLLMSVLSEELDLGYPSELLVLGDNIKKTISVIEPVQMKAMKQYVRQEVLKP